MQTSADSVSLVPRRWRRALLGFGVIWIAAAAVAFVVQRAGRGPLPNPALHAQVHLALEHHVARSCRHHATNGPATFAPLRDADRALAEARRLPPPDALRAELAVLAGAVEYPRCRAALIDLAIASAMSERAEEAVRATWTAPGLTAADRAAAAAALAALDPTPAPLERIIADERELILVQIAPSLSGRQDAPISRHAAVVLAVRGFRLDEVWQRACPAGTSLDGCANALARRHDVVDIGEVLARHADRHRALVAMRDELR